MAWSVVVEDCWAGERVRLVRWPGDRLMAYVNQFEHGDWTVVVEDDDEVGYAYLLVKGKIVADVWLYNRTMAPQRAPWNEPGATMPFRNPLEYVVADGVIEGVTVERVSVRWHLAHGLAADVSVCIDSTPVAWLKPGAKPGWAAMASKDGPLALARQVHS